MMYSGIAAHLVTTAKLCLLQLPWLCIKDGTGLKADLSAPPVCMDRYQPGFHQERYKECFN